MMNALTSIFEGLGRNKEPWRYFLPHSYQSKNYRAEFYRLTKSIYGENNSSFHESVAQILNAKHNEIKAVNPNIEVSNKELFLRVKADRSNNFNVMSSGVTHMSEFKGPRSENNNPDQRRGVILPFRQHKEY